MIKIESHTAPQDLKVTRYRRRAGDWVRVRVGHDTFLLTEMEALDLANRLVDTAEKIGR